MYVCMSGGKKCSSYGKFGVLCFLEIPVLKFTLLPYYPRINMLHDLKNNHKDVDKTLLDDFCLYCF